MNKNNFMRQKGFTLIELLVVVGILGLLVSFGLARYFDTVRKAEIEICNANQKTIKKALQIYRIRNGHYPNAEGEGVIYIEILFNRGYFESTPYCPRAKSPPPDPWADGKLDILDWIACAIWRDNGNPLYIYNTPDDGETYTLRCPYHDS